MAALPAVHIPARSWRFAVPLAEAVALGCIGLVLLLQLELAFAKSINWDEFFHFSLIHQHLRGEPVPLFQTPFVWLFAWVPTLPGDTIADIQLIRALMLPFELAVLAALFGIASHFAGRKAALLCTLAYAAGGWVFLHALALRADMIAAAFLMVALWLALCRPLRPLTAALTALLLVLAVLSTIKSLLYAPAFLGVAWLRWYEAGARSVPKGLWIGSVLAPLAALGLFAAFAPGALAEARFLTASSLGRMFSGGFFPQGHYLVDQLRYAPLLALLIAFAMSTLAFWRVSFPLKLAAAGLLLPLLSLAVYRNAFPYFFTFILPPAVAASAPIAEWVIRRYGLVPFSTLLLLNAVWLSQTQDRGMLQRQQTIHQGVREIFPQPVVYIDDAGMIGDFPRAVPHFASGWALANYRAAGVPEYSLAMHERTVPLVLGIGSPGDPFAPGVPKDPLLAEDRRTLRDNFIPHWGLVFVAGKRIAAGEAQQEIEVLVPGTYTLEAAPITVDGVRFRPGQTITLPRGPVMVLGDRRREAVLRWGDHLPTPAFAWPESFFTDY